MSSDDGSDQWSIVDSVKRFPSNPEINPEMLMAEINVAIAALECAHFSTRKLFAPWSKSSGQSGYDFEIAEEAYKLGCIALSEGKIEQGIHSLNISMSKYPPNEIDAVAKVQSLLSFTVQRLQRSSM